MATENTKAIEERIAKLQERKRALLSDKGGTFSADNKGEVMRINQEINKLHLQMIR